MTQIYHYHSTTKEYLGHDDLEFDQITNEPLLPRSSTLISPPTIPDDSLAVFTSEAWVIEPDPDKQFILVDAQQVKSNEINITASAEITSGFMSSALGVEHLYPSKETDQLNLAGIVASGSDRSFKCSSDDGVSWVYAPHTATQIKQVANDGIDFKEILLVKAATLKAQIALATNQSELDAISWD